MVKTTTNTRSDTRRFFIVRPDINQEDALVHASELMQCALITAYEAADSLRGPQRDHAMSAMYLVEQAKALVDGMLDRQIASSVWT